MKLKNKKELTVNEAWETLFTTHNILNIISQKGIFSITANQIKEFKEPRLMAKFDSSEKLPEIFEKNKINILPTSRSSYVLGNFLLYEELPKLTENVTKMEQVIPPEFESININNITSEANAIHLLTLTNMLDDFLATENNYLTFSGRMGTPDFDFLVNTCDKKHQRIFVSRAQCEIDAGFENTDCIVILEAKNVLHKDFHIRQLYYPYRLWRDKVNKPIRLVFAVYTNQIYHLIEYKFTDLDDYSSIQLVQNKSYSLQDTKINLEELYAVRKKTPIKYTDKYKKKATPFVQADSFDRVISLLENLYNNPLTETEIADLMCFKERQSSYYFNAGKYLGLFEKIPLEGNKKIVQLTPLGNKIYKLNFKERQLKLVSLILEHQIFAEFFDYIYEQGDFPSTQMIIKKMKDLNVCPPPKNNKQSTIKRRAGSVSGWLQWIFYLIRL